MKTSIRFIVLFLLSWLFTSCDLFNDLEPENATSIKPIILVSIGEFQTYHENMPRDSVTILDYGLNSLFNHILKIEIQYQGGCRHHTFELLASNFLYLSNPPQVPIFLGHNAFNDPCSTLIHDVIYFDLRPLRDKYRNSSAGKAGAIILRLNDEHNDDWTSEDCNMRLNL